MSDVLISRQGPVGRLTLNRPEVLNALTLGMVRTISAQLAQWEADPALRVVVLDGAGPKAFCAGGDVTALHAAAMARDQEFPRQFWSEEYALNDRIARYGKPVVALIHGFCMGGGVGLACHARHRIVAESARIAMPECAIGLVPDVGGTALLSAAPAGIGPWLALTGARLEPLGAIAAGFADAFIPQVDWPAFCTALETGAVVETINRHAAQAPGAALPGEDLRRAFMAATVPGILERLASCADPAARAAEAAMAKGSPLAMATALAMQQKISPKGDLRAALELEFRAVMHALTQGDFAEGVRARIIARDDAPRWRHAGPDQVGRIEVADQLAALDMALTFRDTETEGA